MPKSLKFVAGVWAGASLLAFPAASLLLYLLTGKIALPEFAGGGLLDPQDVASGLQDWSEHEVEQPNG